MEGEIERNMKWLTTMANEMLSDKGNTFYDKHYYTRHYAKLFTPIREKVTGILEVGLNIPQSGKKTCPSLRMWADFFPAATIHGADINVDVDVFNTKIHIHHVDQSNPESVQKLAHEFEANSLDIIIDDASHFSWDQQLTMVKLFPLLKSGGMYIIEDLQCKYVRPNRPVHYTTDVLCERISSNQPVVVMNLDADEVSAFVQSVDKVEFYDSQTRGPKAMVVVYRK